MPINFETDPLKHYVRRYGWLPAAQEQKRAIKNRSKRIPLRYFTFCAAGAIDVFMLEREGILKRSEETGRLEGVYFCEENDENFGIIADLIGKPENGFLGTFEDIVLFEEDEETDGKELKDELENSDAYSDKVREKLGYKDTHYRLREAFPFDIINLDVCGDILPPKVGIITPLLDSIIQILKWQTESKFPVNKRECKQFTLFLTSRISRNRINEEAIQQFTELVISNMGNLDFRQAFMKRYKHDQVQKFLSEDFAEFFSLALPKFIIQRALYDHGWEVTPGATYLFHRDNKWDENKPYQIMHAVSVYKRIQGFKERVDVPNTSQYIRSVTQLINNGVEWVDSIIKSPSTHRLLKEDLRQIVAFRKVKSGI